MPALWALALVATAGCGKKGEATAEGRPTPSGFPVPRYVSLKFATVNGRVGPGDDYRILWTYHVKGLPLQVVAESADWRKVCDPDGGVAWVQARTIDGRRNVMRVDARDLTLRRGPSETEAASAMLVGRGVAALDRCKEGWCKVSVDHVSGWVRQSSVWGALDRPQCK